MKLYFLVKLTDDEYVAGPYGSYYAALNALDTGPSSWVDTCKICSVELPITEE